MADLHLYHLPGTRSCIIYWLLKELQIPFQLHTFKERADLKAEEHLKRNPLGKVPAFSDASGTMYESGAILQYILKVYGKGQLQPAAEDLVTQQKFLQWLWFSEANMQSNATMINFHTRFLPEDQRIPQIVQPCKQKLGDCLKVLEGVLASQQGDYILGDKFSAADVMLGQGLKNSLGYGMLDAYPAVAAYTERMRARPAYQEAYGLS